MVNTAPTLYTLAAGTPQTVIAKALGTDVQRVKRWLHHLQPLPALHVNALARAIDAPVSAVLASASRTVEPTDAPPKRHHDARGRPPGATKAAMRARFQDPPP